MKNEYAYSPRILQNLRVNWSSYVRKITFLLLGKIKLIIVDKQKKTKKNLEIELENFVSCAEIEEAKIPYSKFFTYLSHKFCCYCSINFIVRNICSNKG